MANAPILRGQSIGEEAYDRILSMIIRLQIPPGGRISVDALVRELGVSQTPIRAALNRLQAQGLVVSSRHVGFSAAPLPNADWFCGLYQFRSLVEGHAIYKAAQNITDDDIDELNMLMDSLSRYDDSSIEDNYSHFAQSDSEFHNWILEKSGNLVASTAMRQLHIHFHIFRLRFHSIVTSAAVPEHQEIVGALTKRDPNAAKVAMEHHIEMSRQRMHPYYRRL